jgi:hypothetical protein
MTNGNDPAHPCSMPVMAKDSADGMLYRVGEQPRTGLTIREYFAAMAMQGFCSYETDDRIEGWERKWARTACEIADALIAELNKAPK